jgi:hypothetical protein
MHSRCRLFTRLGNGGRNILRADSLKQVDLSMTKLIPVTETKWFEFRCEIFSFNHPYFSHLERISTNPREAKSLRRLNSDRIVEFALKFYF